MKWTEVNPQQVAHLLGIEILLWVDDVPATFYSGQLVRHPEHGLVWSIDSAYLELDCVTHYMYIDPPKK